MTHQPPDPALAAKVLADSNARTAHHEAGHAVAAVARGGRLIGVWVNDIDWTVLPLDADIGKGGTATCTAAFEDQPFAYYAGPWAEAMWTCQNDPDVDDFDEALEYAWTTTRTAPPPSTTSAWRCWTALPHSLVWAARKGPGMRGKSGGAKN